MRYMKKCIELFIYAAYGAAYGCFIYNIDVVSYQPIKLQVENIQNAYGLLHAATKIKILHLNMHAWG